MKTDVWFPLYIGDYLADTARLTTEQHGAYLLLIMDYWRNGPPPDDDAVLAQITRMSPDAWSNACSTIRAFFKHCNGELHHTRIDKELDEAKRKKSVAVAKADKAARARWHKDAPSTPQAMLEQCPSPSPSPIDTKSTPLSDSQANTDPVPLEDKKPKPATDDAKAVIDFLNLRTGRKYRHTKSNLDPILARMREGYTVQEIRTVTMRKVNDWLTDEKMNEYLRPATLYTARNFNSYAGILT